MPGRFFGSATLPVALVAAAVEFGIAVEDFVVEAGLGQWNAMLLAALIALSLAAVAPLAGWPVSWKLAPRLALILAVSLLVTASCGGKDNGVGPTPDPGTPAGTHSFTVTGTAGSLEHSVSVSITVR